MHVVQQILLIILNHVDRHTILVWLKSIFLLNILSKFI